VSGTFYSDDARELDEELTTYFDRAAPSTQKLYKAVIAPHAGTIFSGPVAAQAYKVLEGYRDQIKKVVLLGPSHRVAFEGMALSEDDGWETPLGEVPLDKEGAQSIENCPGVFKPRRAHALEHIVEIHLPFLQKALESFTLLPIVVGDARPEDVAEVLKKVWGGDETLIVISSDLSHYLSYDDAKKVDAQTSKNIINLKGNLLQWNDCCGRIPIQGLLLVAGERGLKAEILDYRNSGDTAGPHEKVVGYGAYGFYS